MQGFHPNFAGSVLYKIRVQTKDIYMNNLSHLHLPSCSDRKYITELLIQPTFVQAATRSW